MRCTRPSQAESLTIDARMAYADVEVCKVLLDVRRSGAKGSTVRVVPTSAARTLTDRTARDTPAREASWSSLYSTISER